MIPYAGYDPNEGRRGVTKGVTAYELFGLGYDTMRIAKRLGISEAKALKLVNEERSAVLHKRNPYAGESNG